ncbi:MAG: hypothetical protein Q9M94_03980 [Candidatus Gracilibacteria bacterium]|nr:hypothetical protein [Candidatus Gracilibacteria bacterium]MDQ7023238.1 hypothetical protein [Candidatus Gracilibacteria bacterium]
MGASSQERLMEDHEIILVGADDLDEAKKLAIEKNKINRMSSYGYDIRNK